MEYMMKHLRPENIQQFKSEWVNGVKMLQMSDGLYMSSQLQKNNVKIIMMSNSNYELW